MNLIEFALGLNPDVNSAGSVPEGEVIGSDLVLKIIQPAGVSGIVYGAEWSSNLQAGSWNSIPDSGTPPQHTFRKPVVPESKVFLRLRMTAP